MTAALFAVASWHAALYAGALVAAVLLCLAVGCLVTAVGMRKR